MNGMLHHPGAVEQAHIRSRKMLVLAINPSVLLPALQNAWSDLADAGIGILDCIVERVYERSSGGFTLSLDAKFKTQERTYQQPLIGELLLVDPRQYHDDLVRRFTKQKRRHQLKNPSRPFEFCLVMELDLIVRFAGLDEKIDGLDLLHCPEKIEASMPGLFQTSGKSVETQLLAHRLHRRSVIEVRVEGSSSIFLKLYKRGSKQPERNAELVRFLEHTAFANDSPSRVPALLGLLPSCSGFAMAGAQGLPLNELKGEERLRGMALAGEAIGRMHRLPLRLDTAFTADDEFKLLSKIISLVSDVFPALRRSLTLGLTNVSTGLANCRGTVSSIVHRDFHERQIIVSESFCTLIDFDTVCNGDPNQDIGNFLAHLDLAEMQGLPGSAEDSSAFLDAYMVAHRKPDFESVAVHRQSTLLRLACIYAFSGRLMHLSQKLIDMAQERRI